MVSLYLFSGIGLSVDNMYLLEQVGAYLHAVDLPFIIGADWNSKPAELTDSGWSQAGGGSIVSAGAPSYEAAGQSSELDFFLVRNDM